MADTSNERVDFVRVGWMQYYGLQLEPGGPIGGGAYNEEHVGSEIENFKPRRGMCYGFAQVSRTAGGFNLARIAGERNAGDQLDGVLVVSVARRPGGSQRVVGWHSKATIYRESHDRPGGGYGVYNFKAQRQRTILLNERFRAWKIPKGAAGMGQSTVFYTRYPDGRLRRDRWIREILQNITRYRAARQTKLVAKLEAEEGRRFRYETERATREPALVRACLERDDYRCRHCGFAVDNQRFSSDILPAISLILHAHHVHPLRDGIRKNRLEHLVTLCPTCHAVAHSIARAVDSAEVRLSLLRKYYRPTGGP